MLVVSGTGHYQEFETGSISDLYMQHDSLPHLSLILPESIVAELLDAVRAATEKGAIHMVRYSLGLGSNEEYFEAKAIPLNASYVLLLIQNVTTHEMNKKALYQRNALLQVVIDTVPPEITAFDNQGNIMIINRAALKNGIAEGIDLENETLNLKPDGKTAYAEDELPLVRAFKGEVVHDQLVIKKRENYYPRTYLVNAVPLKDDAGHSNGVLLAERDVTDIQNVQHQLKSKIKDFDMFMYRASHDLKSPLSAMQGVIDFAIDKTTDKEFLDYLRLIKKSHAMLSTTVNDLIGLTRISQKEIVLNKIILKEFVSDIVDILRQVPQAKSLNIKALVQDGAELTADEGLLRAVLQNLICNAIIHHRPEGEDRFVLVTVISQPKSVFIEVIDNGLGMPKPVQEKVYDIFYRANLSVAGSGLGLFIVKQAIEKMGASIKLLSEVGVGTTFSITIPR